MLFQQSFGRRGPAATFATLAVAAVVVLSACGADSNHEGGQTNSGTAAATPTGSANEPTTAASAAPGTTTAGGASSETTGGAATGTITVFAAASLQGAFDKIGMQFDQAHPNAHVRFSYAGSSALATQINDHAPADVFASANNSNMQRVVDANHVVGQPKIFARNTLEIMVAHGNPHHIMSLSDLTNSAVRVAVCAPDVPCGSFAKEVFEKANVTVTPVSQETSVTGVVTRVSTGEADAGIVYTTDVLAGGSRVQGISIPADQNVIAEYPIAELTNAPNSAGATAFIDYVASPAGQAVLASFGFKGGENLPFKSSK